MQQGSDTAHIITRDLLDRSGEAFITGDFGLFRDCIALPYVVETFEGKRTIQNAFELLKLFEAVRTHHLKTGVTHMARHVIVADFRTEDTIVATFETRLVNGTILTQDPYPTFAIIVRYDAGWRTNKMTFAIEDRPSHNAALMGSLTTRPGPGNTYS